MMRYSTIVLIISLLFGCQDKQEDFFASQGKNYFRTTPPSRIYFKNIRSYNYQSRTLSQSRAELFQLQKMVQGNQQEGLVPTIIDHWLEDEAYLMLLPHPPVLENLNLKIRWESESEKGQFAIQGLSPEEHRTAIERILEGWGKNQTFFLEEEGSEVPLWHEEDKKTYFRQVYADYLRLTESN